MSRFDPAPRLTGADLVPVLTGEAGLTSKEIAKRVRRDPVSVIRVLIEMTEAGQVVRERIEQGRSFTLAYRLPH